MLSALILDVSYDGAARVLGNYNYLHFDVEWVALKGCHSTGNIGKMLAATQRANIQMRKILYYEQKSYCKS